jgi:hypothetical protein
MMDRHRHARFVSSPEYLRHMLTNPRTRVLVTLVAATVAALPVKAAAQGFFESLFGVASRPSAPPQRAPRPLSPTSAASAPRDYRDRPNIPERTSIHRSEGLTDDAPQPSSSGRYRTLCVRMCDGYYWPISASVSRAGFYHDANLCRATCGSEARLFFHDKSSGDTSSMVDVSGRAYARLPVAFLYRKSLVSGCACKPEPWSESELDRHRHYAAEEAAAKAKDDETARPAAMASDRSPAPAIAAVESDASTEPAPQRMAHVEPSRVHVPEVESEPVKRGPPRALSAKRSNSPASARVQNPPSRKSGQQQLAKAHRKSPPAGVFGLGASTGRWPGD